MLPILFVTIQLNYEYKTNTNLIEYYIISTIKLPM